MEMENVLSQRRRIRERVKCFQKVCYVVLRGKKNGDGKGKKKCWRRKMLPTQDVRRINIKKGKIRHDKSSRDYALALEMFYSDSIYDICGAS